MRQKIRIQDVAAAAGVSTQTVSRVLNKKPYVTHATSQKILAAIHDLGYEPNLLARGLASNRTHVLGLVTHDFSDPTFAAILAAAEREAREHDYFFLVASSEFNAMDEAEILRLFVSHQVAGVIVTSQGRETDADIVSLLNKGMPVVDVSPFIRDNRIPGVTVNNLEGGYKAARHLLELGHSQIAMITGPMDNMSSRERMEGFCKALDESGNPLNPQLIAHGNWDYPSGYLGLRELMTHEIRFTGLFVQNDCMAIAAMEALREVGYRIPEDVSVIGFDDTPEASFSHPPLTTIRQSPQEIGRTATRILIDLIEHPEAIHDNITLPTDLVVRQSTCSQVSQAVS